MPLTLESNQILPFVGILLSILFHATLRPRYLPPTTPLHTLSVRQQSALSTLPPATQLLFGLSLWTYATTQHDVFLHLQAVPAVAFGALHLLRVHAHVAARRRRAATEAAMAAALAVLGTVWAATTVSRFNSDSLVRVAAGAVAGAATLAAAGAAVAAAAVETVDLALPLRLPTTTTTTSSSSPSSPPAAQTDPARRRRAARSRRVTARPPALLAANAACALLYGAAWAAYGFWDTADAFIFVPFFVWCGYGVAALALVAWAAVRDGGVDFGGETSGGEEDGGEGAEDDDDDDEEEDGDVESVAGGRRRRAAAAAARRREYGDAAAAAAVAGSRNNGWGPGDARPTEAGRNHRSSEALSPGVDVEVYK
ncbi:hypothetical protein DFJ73DRAFT_773723 [Zopfochytrium polystomum]|nr:hypothetical protein DFJ73DRAFT_773723 [Zopfochytrium polystomum]